MVYRRLALLALLSLAIGCTRLPGTPAQPAPTLTPALVHIRVRVYAGGEPLPDAQVELYRGQFEPIPGELAGAATTNAEGVVEFELAAGPYGLWVRTLALSSQWRYEGPTRFTFSTDEEIVLRMLPAY